MAVLRHPGAWGFVVAGFVGRLPISMVSLGIVLLISGQSGNYAQAGALAAVYALASALIGPLGSRWADRAGQHRAVPVLAAVQIAALAGFVAAAARSAPVGGQVALLVVAGGLAPNVGSLVRARWAALLPQGPALRSAFALEAVIDEVVFVVGPPLMTAVALGYGEAPALLLCLVLIAVGTGLLSAQRGTQPPARGGGRRHDHGRLWSVPLLVLVVQMMLMGGVFGSFEVTTVAFTQALDARAGTGVVLALYALGSLVAGVILARVHLRQDLTTQMLWFTAALAVVTAPLPFVASVPALAGAAFASGLAVSPVLITAAVLVPHLVPAPRLTEALTITTSGIAVGLAVASPVSGALIDGVGPAAGYLVMAACAVAAFGVAATTTRALRRTGSSHP